MFKSSKALRALLLACGLALALQGCGGGNGNESSTSTGTGTGTTTSSTSTGGTNAIVTSGTNVVAMTVQQGPNPNAPNVPFVTVKVCASGSTTACDTISNVMVDTGSTGFRVINSSLVNSLASMTQNTDSGSGNPVSECGAFVSGYTWGSVRTADITVGQETATDQNIEVIADPASGIAPSTCSSTAPSAITTATELGANGILGVQGFLQDCGTGCSNTAEIVTGAYYECASSGTCASIAVPVAQQVGNTVAGFTTDNNGVILQMPSVAATGAASSSGSLVFGIGTETNNGLKQAIQIPTDDNFAFVATYNGSAISNSFVDSGSNFLFFSDSTIALCTASGLTSFYCPTTTLSETATLTPSAGTTSTTTGSTSTTTASYPAAFSIANAATVLASTSDFAFSNVGANVSSQGLGMDFGMPFFYGKNVYIGFEGAVSSTSTSGTAGFVAFSSTGQ